MDKILIYILFFMSISMQLSANEIESIHRSESGIIRLSFDKYPIEYKTKLSDDKKQIQIILSEPIPPVIIDKYRTDKKISLTSLRVNKDTLTLGFDTEIGYTAPSLPYSNSVLIETFKWKDLSSSQDIYRTALLAYEDDIIGSAVSGLKSSLDLGEINAAAFLGFISIKRGYYESAERYFLYAESKESDIFEIYAALASIYAEKSDSAKSSIYEGLYKSKSNNSIRLHDWAIPSPSPDTSALAAHSSELIFNPLTHTSDENWLDLEQSQPDTAASDFLADSYADDNFLLEWLLYAAAFFGIIILYVYFKWRNEQLKRKNNINKTTTNSTQKSNFDEKLRNAAKANEIAKLKAKKLYAEAKASQETPNEEKQKSKNPEEILLDALKKNKKYFDEKMRLNATAGQNKPSLSAKAQLALHLAEEQQRIKSQSLDKINSKNVDLSPGKLSEISKKLGIEKGGLETKIALNKYINSKEGLKKLADKFGNKDENS